MDSTLRLEALEPRVLLGVEGLSAFFQSSQTFVASSENLDIFFLHQSCGEGIMNDHGGHPGLVSQLEALGHSFGDYDLWGSPPGGSVPTEIATLFADTNSDGIYGDAFESSPDLHGARDADVLMLKSCYYTLWELEDADALNRWQQAFIDEVAPYADQNPSKQIVLMPAVPLRSESGLSADAEARARDWGEWLGGDFISTHTTRDHVYSFDLFDFWADAEDHPTNANALERIYCRAGGDEHPNDTAYSDAADAITAFLQSDVFSDAPPQARENEKFDLWTDPTTQLRGTNIYQRIVYPELDGPDIMGSGHVGPPYTQDDFDALAAYGANYVNISHPGLFTQDAPFVPDTDVQDNLDNLLTMIEAADMFAVISFRTGPGRSDFTFYWDEAGTWFDESYLNDTVWEDQATQDAWSDMWAYTAERYDDNPIVVGYDLMVEPNSNDRLLDIWDPQEFHDTYAGTLYDWNQMYPDIVEAVRAVDTKTPILVGGNSYSSVEWLPWLETTDDPYTVYTVHQYSPHVYTHQAPGDNRTYPGVYDVDWDSEPDTFNRDWIDALLAAGDTFSDTHDVPMAVNEFGLVRYAPDADTFMDDSMDLFEQRGWNHALWVWDPAWPTWNVENDDFNFLHGPDPDHHTNVASSDLIDAITEHWAQNTIQPSDANTEPINWAEIDDWLCQYQQLDVDTVRQTAFDLIDMDTLREDGQWYTADQIDTLQESGKSVLAYMQIGQAEDYRDYWQEEWNTNPPDWMGPEDPDWAGLYWVRFWEQDWKDILYGESEAWLDRIMTTGYNGVYLDSYDPWYWEGQGVENVDQLMSDLIVDIADYAHGIDPNFSVVPQDPRNFDYTDPDLLAAIEAVGIEEPFYGSSGEGVPVPPEERAEIENMLAYLQDQGKVILTIDYPFSGGTVNWTQANIDRVADAHQLAHEADYIEFTGVYDLDSTTPQPSHEPRNLSTDWIGDDLTFSWTFDDPDAAEAQVAWRILVATDETLLTPAGADLWNSGFVSSATTQAAYAGSALPEGTTVFWAIQTVGSVPAVTLPGPFSSATAQIPADENHPPVADPGAATTDEDIPVDVTLTATDIDDDTLTYHIVTTPAHGAVILADNVATYTPADDYNGLDSFTFRAYDGLAYSDPATVSITIEAEELVISIGTDHYRKIKWDNHQIILKRGVGEATILGDNLEADYKRRSVTLTGTNIVVSELELTQSSDRTQLILSGGPKIDLITTDDDLGKLKSRRGALTGVVRIGGDLGKLIGRDFNDALISIYGDADKIKMNTAADSLLLIGYDIGPDGRLGTPDDRTSDGGLNQLIATGPFENTTLAVGVRPADPGDPDWFSPANLPLGGRLGKVIIRHPVIDGFGPAFGLVADHVDRYITIGRQKYYSGDLPLDLDEFLLREL